MHISEGVLSIPVLGVGAALSAIGIVIGLKKINSDNLPKIAVLTATFFIASFIHINVGPSSIHFMLNGLVGAILGWAAFPVIFIGLLLQAILFQFGGLTTLGINTLNIAAPSVFFGYLFHNMIIAKDFKSSVGAFLVGFSSIAITVILVYLCLILTNFSQYHTIALTLLVSHLPVMILEGLIVLICVRFLKRTKQEILETMFRTQNI